MKHQDGALQVGRSDSLTSGTSDHQTLILTPYNSLLTNNPYIAQIYAKGRDYVPTPAPKATYPREIHGRVYNTEAEYKAALADFLNGL